MKKAVSMLAKLLGRGTPGEQLQEDAMDVSPIGGDDLRHRTETIWSPYGPYPQPELNPSLNSLLLTPPAPKPEDPKREAMAPGSL